MTYSETQRARVNVRTPWSCDLLFEAERSYLVRVDHQAVDVALELRGPGATSAVRVDSPTRRAGPEILFFRALARGTHCLVVSAVEHGAAAQIVDVHWREVPEAQPGTALARGLAALTSSASFPEKRNPVDARRCITLLRSARTDLDAAGAAELEAEARLRIAAACFWDVNDWKGAAGAAQEAMQAFDALADPTMAAQAALIRGTSLAELAGASRRGRASAAAAAEHAWFDEAERLLERAANRFLSTGMKYHEAHALNNLGLALFYRGRYEDARARYLAAARLFAEAGERASEALPLRNILALNDERRDYADAVHSFERYARVHA